MPPRLPLSARTATPTRPSAAHAVPSLPRSERQQMHQCTRQQWRPHLWVGPAVDGRPRMNRCHGARWERQPPDISAQQQHRRLLGRRRGRALVLCNTDRTLSKHLRHADTHGQRAEGRYVRTCTTVARQHQLYGFGFTMCATCTAQGRTCTMAATDQYPPRGMSWPA